MNDAIDYLESCITENEKIDYAQAARVACCSPSRFQNMFLFVTDMSPSEYVRHRRMALSAYDLIHSGAKIIELSLKYGYESAAAYTRSFTTFHGISPSVARKFKKYTDYPRISFQINITGGNYSMEANKQMTVYKDILIKMETVELSETLKFAGVTSVGLPNFQNIGAYHERHSAYMKETQSPYTEMGISFGTSSWVYLFGCQVGSIDNLPDGMCGLDTGLTKFACLTFRVQPGGDLLGGGDGPGDGMNTASEYLTNEWLPKNADKVYNNFNGRCFRVKKSEKVYRIFDIPHDETADYYDLCYWIEVYKEMNIEEEPEMCFYIPLR